MGWDFGVNIIPGESYTPDGSELSTPFSDDRTYKLDESAAFVNRFWEPKLKPIILYDDNGGGYTYYKPRELGEVLDFNVGWGQDRGLYMETDRPYSTAD